MMTNCLTSSTVRVLCQRRNALVHIPMRWKHRQKKKWAKSEPVLSPTHLALGYFDSFYKPVYGSMWASMRVALLSQQKYGVLLNNFVSAEETERELFGEGAFDIAEQARMIDHTETFHTRQKRLIEQLQNLNSPTEEQLEPFADQQMVQTDRTDLSYFMPTKRVVSEKEQLADTELKQGFMELQGLDDLPVYPDLQIVYPQTLKMFTHDRGHVALFSPAKRKDANRLNYYIMDASSILPVLALDLRPNDTVLDLCAAPGGKTLAMLQTGLPGSIICVDNAYDRIRRLREVLHLYTPPSYLKDKLVQVVHTNGVMFANEIKHHMKFDKILVDVPCYTDRHMLQAEDNNIFQKSRQGERLRMQETQTKLLSAALACVKPGGTVVYSTCTLSMPQNDGVVQAAVDSIHQTTDLKIAIVDTSGIADKFRLTFDFYKKCRYGQLVLPNLTANFGPTYFCKMVKQPS